MFVLPLLLTLPFALILKFFNSSSFTPALLGVSLSKRPDPTIEFQHSCNDAGRVGSGVARQANPCTLRAFPYFFAISCLWFRLTVHDAASFGFSSAGAVFRMGSFTKGRYSPSRFTQGTRLKGRCGYLFEKGKSPKGSGSGGRVSGRSQALDQPYGLVLVPADDQPEGLREVPG